MSAHIRALIFGTLLVLIGWTAGYFHGKRGADAWYADHQNTWPENWEKHSVQGMVLDGDCRIDLSDSKITEYFADDYFIQDSDKPCRIYSMTGKQ